MRQLIIVAWAVWFGMAATAQANPCLAPATLIDLAASNSVASSDSASTTTSDNTRYLDNPDLLTGCQARLAAIQDNPCNILFIGDSLTENWLTIGKPVWDKFYAPRHTLNFGVSGDGTQNVLWRLTNMNVQVVTPKVAVILIGTNNYANDPHEIAAGVEAVMANTEEVFPDVKIILVSILPNARANEKMMQTNRLIKSFADNSTSYYLDLVPLMPRVMTTTSDGQTDTNWKGIGDDGLNLTAAGYEIWANGMEPLLTKLLANK